MAYVFMCGSLVIVLMLTATGDCQSKFGLCAQAVLENEHIPISFDDAEKKRSISIDILHDQFKTRIALWLRRFAELSGENRLIDCVGFDYITIHSIANSKYTGPMDNVTVTLKTEAAEFTGAVIYDVSPECLRSRKYCNSSFAPAVPILDAFFFGFSPLDEHFWDNLNNSYVGFPDWLRGLQIQVLRGSIPLSWLRKISVSSLQHLKIGGNKWSEPGDLLGNLPNLKVLYLENNAIQTLSIANLGNTPQLASLMLDMSNMSRLPHGLDEREALISLAVRNQVSSLDLITNVTSNLKHIQSLVLHKVRFRMNMIDLLTIPKLTELLIEECNLTDIIDIDTAIHSGASNLQILKLEGNHLNKLSNAIFQGLKNLIILSLSYNVFENCPKIVLRSLHELSVLDLSRNIINELEWDCFKNNLKLHVLDLSWNNIETLPKNIFVSLAELFQLNLSHNNIKVIQYEILVTLNKLTYLYISNNTLTRPPVLGRVEMKTLDLSNNKLSYVTDEVTRLIKYINHIDLSYNRITHLSFSKINIINLSYNGLPYIMEDIWKPLMHAGAVDFGGNDFQCCHENAKSLLERLEMLKKVLNLGTYNPLKCTKEGEKYIIQENFHKTDFCTLTDEYFVTKLWSTTTTFSVLFLAFLFFLYFYRGELLYIKHLIMLKKNVSRNEVCYKAAVYDAFVCYSGSDLTWVYEQLLPSIEDGPERYRLCIHDRDFTLGVVIDTNVLVSLDKSRKVIFVLTRDFIKSKWCRLELEMANHRMLEEDRTYIILIQLEELDHDTLPRHLLHLMHSRTHLHWPQDRTDNARIQRSWERLRYALGESVYQRTGRVYQGGTVLDE